MFSTLVPKGQLFINTAGWFGFLATGVLWGRREFSLFWSLSLRIGFSANERFSKYLKNWRGKESIYAWSEECIHSQARILPMNLIILQIRHLIAACATPCAPTFENFSTGISIVPCLLGVFGSSARCLPKKSRLSENNKIQAARKFSGEIFFISWRRPYTVRVTESGP